MIKFFALLSFLLCMTFSAKAEPLVLAARRQIGVTLYYDGAYAAMPYPGGDVPLQTGVCSDVVIRAYRVLGIDLQELLHIDMKVNFSAYPKIWGAARPDPNIDHRRVPNLGVFFARHGKVLPLGKDFKAGDIVTWNLSARGNIPHIGIVSDRKNGEIPLVIHNIGAGAMEEDVLFSHTITGHYRYEISEKAE